MIFKGKLMNLDGVPDLSGDSFPENCKVTIKNPVPVTLNFNPKETVGVGTVTKRGKSLRYEIDVDVKKIPEYKSFTPAAGGYIKGRKGKKIITDVTVNHIGLSVSGNADTRIKKLK